MWAEGKSGSTHTYCGEKVYGVEPEKDQWEKLIPDCPRCSLFKTAWVAFTVLPYEHKKEAAKKLDKEAQEQRRRAKFPTAYDRILDDGFLETLIYKTEKAPKIVPEPDPLAVYYLDERERKLQSARERNQRLKAAKRHR